MKLSRIFVVVLTLILLVSGVFAQSCECPIVGVSGPSGVTPAGEPAIFNSHVSDKYNQPSYKWTVSAGTIIEGQGTPTIKVDTKGLKSGQIIIAVVTVSGNWCQDCTGLTRDHIAIIEEKIEPVLIDKFERSNCEDVLSRMDNFMTYLQNDPNATGYFIAYGKPRIVARAEREARNWIKMKGFDPLRITLVSGGGSSERAEIELWMVPAGANPPEIKAQSESAETEPEKEVINLTQPYIFSSEYYDGVGGCEAELDLEGYAKMLKDNPKSRGNIVILMMTKAEFRKKEKEILSYLTKKGIARKRLQTFHQKTFGGVELWFLP